MYIFTLDNCGKCLEDNLCHWVLASWLIWSVLDRAPNSSSPYSSCLLSCWYQIYLITWTLHSKLSVVSFLANYGVLLLACCIMSKVCFLTAWCDMAAFLHITVCFWPNENISCFILAGGNTSARLSWAGQALVPFSWEYGWEYGKLKQWKIHMQRWVWKMFCIFAHCCCSVPVSSLLSTMTNSFQSLSLPHWAFSISMQLLVMLIVPWNIFPRELYLDKIVFLLSIGHFTFLHNLLFFLVWWYTSYSFYQVISSLALRKICWNHDAFLASLEKWNISFSWSLSSAVQTNRNIVELRHQLDFGVVDSMIVQRMEGDGRIGAQQTLQEHVVRNGLKPSVGGNLFQDCRVRAEWVKESILVHVNYMRHHFSKTAFVWC